MLIRPWTKEDIGQISEMEARCFSDPWSSELLADCLKYPVYDCFLLEEEGTPCGYGCLITLFDEGEIANVAVDIPFRGRGYATMLMEKMHERAKEKGAAYCLLEVRVGNRAARSLYEKLGYAEYGVRKKYYADGEDALLMKKSL